VARERDEALRAAAKAKAELAEYSSKEAARLEARHREAESKLSSEVSRLRFQLKEAEGQVGAVAAGLTACQRLRTACHTAGKAAAGSLGG
jgi:hypothetical protein